MRANALVVMVWAAAGPVVALDLAGHWSIRWIGAPDDLGLSFNGNGHVIGVQNRLHFESGTGYGDIVGVNFTGDFDGPFNGSVNVDARGVAGTSAGETYYVNENGDFAAGVEAEPGFIDLNCMVKAADATPPVSVLEGHWNLVSMDLPHQLNLNMTSEGGEVTGVQPLDHFGVFAGHADFGVAGNFTGEFDGPMAGSAGISAPGLVSSPDFADGETYQLNAGGDIMISSNDEGDAGGYRYFTALLKAPVSCQTHELRGHWHLVSFETPDELILQKDVSDYVIGIDGNGHFGVFTGYLDISGTGAVAGEFDGPVGGSAAVSGPGRVAFTLAGEGGFDAYINASKDVMMGVIPEVGTPGFSEIVILVRSVIPRLPVINEAAYSQFALEWVDDGGVVLQRSVDLAAWNNVTVSNGTYTETPAPSGKAFFRLVPTP